MTETVKILPLPKFTQIPVERSRGLVQAPGSIVKVNVIQLRLPKDIEQSIITMDATCQAEMNGVEEVTLGRLMTEDEARVKGFVLKKLYRNKIPFKPVGIYNKDNNRGVVCAFRIKDSLNPRLLAERVNTKPFTTQTLSEVSGMINSSRQVIGEVDLGIITSLDDPFDIGEYEAKDLLNQSGFEELTDSSELQEAA